MKRLTLLITNVPDDSVAILQAELEALLQVPMSEDIPEDCPFRFMIEEEE